MLPTPILVVLAVVGVVGCFASLGLFLWSTHQHAVARMQTWESLKKNNTHGSDINEDNVNQQDYTLDTTTSAPDALSTSAQDDEPTTNNNLPANNTTKTRFPSCQQSMRQKYAWFVAICTIIVVIYITVTLLWDQAVSSIQMVGLVLAGWTLAFLWLCRCILHNAPQHEVQAMGFFLLYVATLALSYYSIASLLGHNPADDSSSYYHGPVPILGYQGQHENYQDVARQATLVVGYGGSWACPNSDYNSNNNDDNDNNVWCTEEVELSWCDAYDQTGYFANTNYGSMEPTWRTWEGQDLWKNNRFSCAKGMANEYQNNGDDDDDEANNNENGDDQYSYYDNQKYLDSPFDSPYLINVFADCNDGCHVAVDDPLFRDKFYFVSSLKYLIAGCTVGAAVFLGLAWYLRRRQTVGDGSSNDAGVELLPETEKEKEFVGVAA